jgi:hypothetical protein
MARTPKTLSTFNPIFDLLCRALNMEGPGHDLNNIINVKECFGKFLISIQKFFSLPISSPNQNPFPFLIRFGERVLERFRNGFYEPTPLVFRSL